MESYVKSYGVTKKTYNEDKKILSSYFKNV